MRLTNTLDDYDVLRLVNRAIDECGGETGFAAHVGVSRQFVHNVMSGGRSMPPRFLAAAGVRKVVTTYYEIIERETAHVG